MQEHVITVGLIRRNYGLTDRPTDVANRGLLSRERPRIGCRVHRPEGCPALASGAIVRRTSTCVTAATKPNSDLSRGPSSANRRRHISGFLASFPGAVSRTACRSLCTPRGHARSKDSKLVLVGGSNLRAMLICLLAITNRDATPPPPIMCLYAILGIPT